MNGSNSRTRIQKRTFLAGMFALVFYAHGVFNLSYAGSMSADFGQFYAQFLEKLTDDFSGMEEISCKKSHIKSDSDKVSRVSICTRVDKESVVTESSPYAFVNDRRVVDYEGNAYVLFWSQLKSNTNGAAPLSPEDALAHLFMDDLVKEKSREKSMRVGFVNSYSYLEVEFDKFPGKCLVIAGRRNRSASLGVLTCSNLEPDFEEIKAFMKLLP